MAGKTIAELKVSHAKWFNDKTIQWQHARYSIHTFDAGRGRTVFVSGESQGLDGFRGFCIRLALPFGDVVNLSDVFAYWELKKALRHAGKLAGFLRDRASVQTCQEWVRIQFEKERKRAGNG